MVDSGGGVQIEMPHIPAGEFFMGSSESAEANGEINSKTFGELFL